VADLAGHRRLVRVDVHVHQGGTFVRERRWPLAGLPFVVAINGWDGQFPHSQEQVREALALAPYVPVVTIDARSRDSVKRTLITLVEHVLRVRAGHGMSA
ncbi:hypothetical protein ACWDUI_27600, partial [Streptosporangium sandarakinum]